MNKIFEDLNGKVKDCNNTTTIFDTRKYVLLGDVKELINRALNLHHVVLPKGTLCISCKKEPATHGIGNRQTLCSKCWNKISA